MALSTLDQWIIALAAVALALLVFTLCRRRSLVNHRHIARDGSIVYVSASDGWRDCGCGGGFVYAGGAYGGGWGDSGGVDVEPSTATSTRTSARATATTTSERDPV